MANNKTAIKNAPVEAVYRFVNDSATGVPLTIALEDLKRTEQNIVGTPTATISALSWCTTSSISVTRGGVLQYFLTGTGEIPNAYGGDATNSDSDIVVTIASGTLNMRLIKGQAYKNPV